MLDCVAYVSGLSVDAYNVPSSTTDSIRPQPKTMHRFLIFVLIAIAASVDHEIPDLSEETFQVRTMHTGT